MAAGLGPAGPDLVPPATRRALREAPVAYSRTGRHPAASGLDVPTFDYLYEELDTFDEVYAAIVEQLVSSCEQPGWVAYAVPGSPSVAERTVELLRVDERVDLEVVPAISFLDLVWDRLGLDPFACGIRLVDGESFGAGAALGSGPFVVAQCWSREVLSGIKLAVPDHEAGALTDVTVLARLGLPDEEVFRLPLAELDREVDPDHLTTVYVPGLSGGPAAELQRLTELVRTLRRRCPWDLEQTHRSLTRHLLEEAYEVLEAIEDLDGSPASYGHLEEELGDLLFQVCFHATLAAEEGQFTMADVASGIHDKLVGRHPHVFGTVDAGTPEAVMTNWEHIKKAEKGRASLLDGIPASLPSVLHAHKVQRKAATVGVETEVDPSVDGLPVTDARVGRLLFSVVALARRAGIDPEAALRGEAVRFSRSFRLVEELAADRGLDLAGLDSTALAGLWSEASAQASRP